MYHDTLHGNWRPTCIGGLRVASLEVVVTEEPVPDPNGIPFSPDHKKICHHQHGRGIQVGNPRGVPLPV